MWSMIINRVLQYLCMFFNLPGLSCFLIFFSMASFYLEIFLLMLFCYPYILSY